MPLARSSISFHNMSFPFESENWLGDARDIASRSERSQVHLMALILLLPHELARCGNHKPSLLTARESSKDWGQIGDRIGNAKPTWLQFKANVGLSSIPSARREFAK